MMLDVTRFFAGFSGAVGTLFLLTAFSTDYWQLGSESCDPGLPAPGYSPESRLYGARGDSPESRLYGARGDSPGERGTLYHEGLFWRCLFKGSTEEESLWMFLIGGHSTSRKICTHTYLFPTLIPDAAMATSSESAEVYRGMFMAVVLLGICLVMVAGLLSIGAHSAARAALYRAAGGLYLSGGLLLLSVLVLHVVWFHGMSTLEHYVLQQGAALCPGFHLSVRYGPSFLIAPVGPFFCLLSGTLHLALAATAEKPLSLPTGNCEKAVSLPTGNCEKALSLPTGNCEKALSLPTGTCEDRDELI